MNKGGISVFHSRDGSLLSPGLCSLQATLTGALLAYAPEKMDGSILEVVFAWGRKLKVLVWTSESFPFFFPKETMS